MHEHRHAIAGRTQRLRLALCAAFLAGAVSAARAEPFYLRYDADGVFPEEAGFTRFANPAGEVRTVENGVLTLDTRTSSSIFDVYYVRSDAFLLEPGEALRVAWRMRTLEDTGDPYLTDVTLSLTNGASQFVYFSIGRDFVTEDEDVTGEPAPEHSFSFSEGTFHDFVFQSSNMQTYSLHVDGELAFEGRFHNVAIIGANVVAFGDAVTGLRSLSQWDFVEIRVVPEPGTGLALVSACACCIGRRRRVSSW